MNALEEVSRASSSVQSKLSLIISRHEQLKVSFEQLNHQIRTGFIEVWWYISIKLSILDLFTIFSSYLQFPLSQGRRSVCFNVYTVDEAGWAEDGRDGC